MPHAITLLAFTRISARCCDARVQTASGRAGTGPGRRFIARHPPGGGISQVGAARAGVPAVGGSAPAVTGVAGVEADWQRSTSKIIRLEILNESANQTSPIGRRLGSVRILNGRRTGGDAHATGTRFDEPRGSGQVEPAGAQDPFHAWTAVSKRERDTRRRPEREVCRAAIRADLRYGFVCRG